MNRKVKHESYGWYDEHGDVRLWNYVISRNDRLRYSKFGLCNHLRKLRGMLFLSGSSPSNFELKNSIYHELNQSEFAYFVVVIGIHLLPCD
jgi:hypothetical protein